MHEVALKCQMLQVSITHMFREANQVADCLAGFGCSLSISPSIWLSWADLPTLVKGPYRLDKIGYPSLRP